MATSTEQLSSAEHLSDTVPVTTSTTNCPADNVTGQIGDPQKKAKKRSRSRKSKQKQTEDGILQVEPGEDLYPGATPGSGEPATMASESARMTYTAFKQQQQPRSAGAKSSKKKAAGQNRQDPVQGQSQHMSSQGQGQGRLHRGNNRGGYGNTNYNNDPYRQGQGHGHNERQTPQGQRMYGGANPYSQQGGYGQGQFMHPDQQFPQGLEMQYDQSYVQPPETAGMPQGQGYVQRPRQPQVRSGQRSRTHQDRKQGTRNPDERGQQHQGSPRGDTGRRDQKPRPLKYCFETYWSSEQVQQCLKRGELIEGPIRINPKNFEDAYIPHPDGQSDIYLCGMKNRNRALNGDVVAVLLDPREHWKVLMDDLNAMRKKDLTKQFKKLALSESGTEDQAAVSSDSGSDTDVIIEEEYYEENADPTKELEPTKSGLSETPASGAMVSVQTACDNPPGADSDLVKPEASGGYSESPKENISGEKSTAPSQGSDSRQKEACDTKQKGQGPRSQGQGHSQPHQKNASKGQGHNQTGSAQKKRYTSLGSLASGEEGLVLSPTVKQLFTSDGAQGDAGKYAEQKARNLQAVPANMILRTAKVVYIIEKKHSRACTGHIRLLQDKNPHQALFSPLDSRLPRILVPMTDCPPGFYERPEDHVKTLFIARIKEWTETSQYAKGEMARSLGEAGEIEPETEGILIEYDIDFEEFSDEAIACLPSNLPWKIPEQEYASRRDLRKECIFTIDPATARDLDDALSCKPLGNGRYEVGVHIADVSHFVQPENALDDVAASRATSVYMVQKVVPMLPRLLCEKLCSLNPDEDRLTFSVIWTVTEHGEIEAEWFGRTVIRSCVKMGYDHAQGMIEDPQRAWTTEELPTVSEGFTIPQIKDIVLLLNKIAHGLRQKRYDSGALRLDQVKLQYTLDKETGMPCGYSVYKQRESNKLVEEFMLLANMAVARQIYKHYPKIAVLRRHPPPQTRMIDELSSTCKQLGIPLDVTNSKTIQRSLAAFSGQSMDDQAKLQILTVLCSKPMQNAKYFCTGVLDDEDDYRHYALNVPFYTHFTSPIRRYPDIMVHRLLAASLGYSTAPRAEKGEVQKQSDHCNDKKTAAKRASELSSEIFFAVFVKECGPLEERGMVMAVLDKAFDVLILKLGVVKRVYCERLPLVNYSYRKDKKQPLLTLTWKADEAHPNVVKQIITIFTHVSCHLSADDQPLKWSAVIKHPSEAGD